MTIQGTEIRIKEYRGQRVITFKDIDTVHQRAEGTASRNFRTNRHRFISGVDFHKITPDEFRRAFGGMDSRQQNDITLITETGYLMLVKSFTDDLAWKVQRDLVDSYFRARAEPDKEVMKKIIAEEVPTLVIDTDKLIKCAEIMAGCLEGNRPFVLNILKNLIPDIGEQTSAPVQIKTEDGHPKTLPDVSEKVVVKRRVVPQGVPIDIPKMLSEMGEQNLSVQQLAKMANVSPRTISNWIAGENQPVLQNRINICVALGKDENFLTPKRKRKVNEK